MSNLAKLWRPHTTTNRLFEATVDRLDADHPRALLRLEPPDDGNPCWATLAVAGGAVAVGDRVLAVGEASSDIYVIGCISKGRNEGILPL